MNDKIKTYIFMFGTIAAGIVVVSYLINGKKEIPQTSPSIITQSKQPNLITSIDSEISGLVSKINDEFSTAPTTLPQTVSYGNGYITISPTTILKNANTNQQITINGMNMAPNSNGYIFVGNVYNSGVEISKYKSDATGNFNIVIYNTEQSELHKTIVDDSSIKITHKIPITAYDYSNNEYSNTVMLNVL